MCSSTAIIDKNDEISLNQLNCNNFHFLKNINFDIYNSENTNSARLKCDSCSTLKIQLTPPNNKFYFCSCGTKLCPECTLIHENEGHNKIEYENKNYFCIEHNKKYISYCLDCNINLCEDCEDL